MEKTIKEQIAIAEEKLRQAMINSDVEALNDLLAPELLFTSHLGEIVSKEQDLAAHTHGAFKIENITLSEQHLLPVEGVVIVSARVYIIGSYNGNPTSGNFRFTRVWSPSPTGGWQVIAGHSCVIKD